MPRFQITERHRPRQERSTWCAAGIHLSLWRRWIACSSGAGFSLRGQSLQDLKPTG